MDVLQPLNHSAKSLKHIDLHGNFIKNISRYTFAAAELIEYINLKHNLIRSIDDYAFSGLEHLRSLRIDNNKLTSITNRTFTDINSLVYLNLAENSISTISDECFSMENLEELVLSGNRLDILEETIFRGAKKLKKVSLARNRIKVIDLSAVIHEAPIEMFDVSDNQIGTFEKQLTNCSKSPDMKLKHLNLARNHLKTAQILHGLNCFENLETINLNTNNFTHIEDVVDLKIFFPHLTIIYLIDNYLKCEWLESVVFDTSLIFTMSTQRRHHQNGITCNL